MRGLLLGLAVALPICPLAAQSSPDAIDLFVLCHTDAPSEQSIAACNGLIDTGTLTENDITLVKRKIAIDYNRIGSQYANDENYSASIEYFGKAIATDPNQMDAYYNRGLAYALAEQYDKAIPDFTQQLAMEPTNVRALLFRALAFEELQRNAEAIADFQAVLKLDPNDEVAREGLDRLTAAAPGGSSGPQSRRDGPGLFIHQNDGTACLDFEMKNITVEGADDPESATWRYELVMTNQCPHSVVWYAEWSKGFSSGGPASRAGPFVYGGYGWPRWSLRGRPAGLDFDPIETSTDVPLGANQHRLYVDNQRVKDARPVEIWLVSCNAYAPDKVRAMTMFNTSEPLSRDGRFACVPNVPPEVRY